MNRAVFANHVLVSDVDLRFSFGRKRKVLRRRADDCAVSDEIAGAYYDLSFKNRVRLNNRSISDSYLRANHCEGTDFHVLGDLRVWIDNCRRMDFHSTPASLKLK